MKTTKTTSKKTTAKKPAARKPAAKKPAAKTTAKRTASNATTKGKGLSADEKAAMKERLQELKAGTSREEGERAVRSKISAMPQPDRGMAERIHAIVKANAPALVPRTWYGMPAYAKGDKVVCFFQNAAKFKARYSTLGFNDVASLDDGSMWPTTFALKKLGPAEEARIAALVKKATG